MTISWAAWAGPTAVSATARATAAKIPKYRRIAILLACRRDRCRRPSTPLLLRARLLDVLGDHIVVGGREEVAAWTGVGSGGVVDGRAHVRTPVTWPSRM